MESSSPAKLEMDGSADSSEEEMVFSAQATNNPGLQGYQFEARHEHPRSGNQSGSGSESEMEGHDDCQAQPIGLCHGRSIRG